MIEQIAGPFGNSTKQNQSSGLVSTRALVAAQGPAAVMADEFDKGLGGLEAGPETTARPAPDAGARASGGGRIRP